MTFFEVPVRQAIGTASGTAALVLVSIAIQASARAHHSFAPFDQSRFIELSGSVVDLKVRSPHSILTIESEDEDGASELWDIEMGPVPNMRRQGIDEDTLIPGDPIVVRGAMRRDGVRGVLLGRGIFRPDGTRVGSGNSPAVATDVQVSGADAADLLSGIWDIQPHRNLNTDGDSPMPLTEWAARFRENYDVTESPAVHCVPPNLPALFYPPYLFGIEFSDDRVVLHHEYFAVIRTVPLGGEPVLSEPSGLFGYATARLDGESLVVESERFPEQAAGLASIYDPNGRGGELPSSTGKRLTERYSVTVGGASLVLEYTVEDPEYLTAAYTDRVIHTRLADSTPIEDFECDEESASRTIHNVARQE